MPFSKISEALAILNNTDLCSEDVRSIIQKLKDKQLDPADACFQIFEFTVGSESHATYAVCYLAILQNDWTTVEEVTVEMKKLLELHYDRIVQERPNFEKNNVSIKDVADRIQQLLVRNLLRVDGQGRIALPQ